MEPLLLAGAKMAGAFIVLLGAGTLFRASLRLFYESRRAAFGIVASAMLGIVLLLATRSVLFALLVAASGALAVHWIWYFGARIADRKPWAAASERDSYEAYIEYLNRPARLFHRPKAIRRLRRLLKEQLAFFLLLQVRRDTPASSLPIRIGSRIHAFDGLKRLRMEIDVHQDFSGIRAAYDSELERRDQLLARIGEWKARLGQLVQLRAGTGDPEPLERLIAEAGSNVGLLESLTSDFHPLMGPHSELGPANLAKLNERLLRILTRALGFVFPPELLLLSRKSPADPGSADFALSIRSRVTSAEALPMVRPSDGVKVTVLHPTLNWHVEMADSGKVADFELITTKPKDYENPLGVNGLYAYLVVRAYCDFAWQLFREMGFVEAPTFDLVVGEPGGSAGDGGIAAEIRRKLGKEFGDLMEGNISELIDSAAILLFMKEYESELRDVARQIEASLAAEVKALFTEGIDLLLHMPLSVQIGDLGNTGDSGTGS